MEELEELFKVHKEAQDLDLEDNMERIAKIDAAFFNLKKQALVINEKDVKERHRFPDLKKIFVLSKILSPTEGYWEKLIIKSLYFPRNMSIGEVFEIGRFTERMFSYVAQNDLNHFAILDFKQTLQHNFR